MKKIISTFVIAATLAGCASQPQNIAATYVSPTAYSDMSCKTLNAEAQRVNQRLSVATGQQSKSAKNDAALTAVTLILFWPAVFFIGGDKGTAAELSRLKGEAEAIQSAAVRRGC
jgi:uncharacterized protein YcfL